MTQLSTCKLVFEANSITRDDLEKMLRKYTDRFEVCNFYPAMFVGNNKICFAIVDLPESAIPSVVNNESKIKSYDFMYSGNGPGGDEEECEPGAGGCGGGGCGCSP